MLHTYEQQRTAIQYNILYDENIEMYFVKGALSKKFHFSYITLYIYNIKRIMLAFW